MSFQYRPGTSWFHRMDPLSKLIWLICLSMLCIYYEQAVVQLGLCLFVMCCGIWLAGLSPKALWRGLRIPFYFTLPYFILQLLILSGETVIVDLGVRTLTAEALDFAAAITLRLITLIALSLVFIATTDPRDVVLVMAQKLRVPYRFAYAVSIALRFLPVINAEAENLRAAARLRGMDEPSGLRNKLVWHRHFLFAVFVNAIRRVQSISEAMEMKGFGAYPARSYRRTIEVSLAGKGLAASTVVGAFMLLFFYQP